MRAYRNREYLGFYECPYFARDDIESGNAGGHGTSAALTSLANRGKQTVAPASEGASWKDRLSGAKQSGGETRARLLG